VVSPLFSAFGPEPIATRVTIGSANVIVTTAAIYKRKIAKIRDQLTSVQHVLVVSDDDTEMPGTLNFHRLMDDAGDDAPIEHTTADDASLLHFTSGTTGTPKGAQHVHGAVAMHYTTGRYALDLHEGDIYWCTADPGWVTGTAYGIISPLLHGVTSIIDEAEFDAERWYRILQDEQVSVWYTAPTAIRMLIKAGPELPAEYRFPHLRFIASVGEPLNAEAVWWGKRVLGLPIHDNWWQTETGGIMVANTPAFDIKPGSMGRPLPGVQACVVEHDQETGEVTVIDEPDVEGELALKLGWPSMFRGYLNQDERYRKCFSGDLYLSGDLVKRRRRLPVVRRPCRRRHQGVRPPDRPVRGGERPDRSPGGGRGRGDRQARSHLRRVGQGVRHAEVRLHRRRRVAPRPDGAGPQAARGGGGTQGDRLRRLVAAHLLRQDHAPAAQGA
jgi:acetyl-CoA synthetase